MMGVYEAEMKGMIDRLRAETVALRALLEREAEAMPSLGETFRRALSLPDHALLFRALLGSARIYRAVTSFNTFQETISGLDALDSNRDIRVATLRVGNDMDFGVMIGIVETPPQGELLARISKGRIPGRRICDVWVLGNEPRSVQDDGLLAMATEAYLININILH